MDTPINDDVPCLKIIEILNGENRYAFSVSRMLKGLKFQRFDLQTGIGEISMEDIQSVIFIQEILDAALSKRVTDVHFHLEEERLRVLFRMGGQIKPHLTLLTQGKSISRRIRALAKMDISDARLPQDGSFVWDDGFRSCQIRVATIPTIQGESMVLRLMDHLSEEESLKDLGMSEEDEHRLKGALIRSVGLCLVAGPTNAGKTTTLYSMMRFLSSMGRDVVSVENPVEQRLQECRQVEVRERIGLTFDSTLRSLLRQDADVLMIGEVRDESTAKVAMRATLSGRLVITTTHARDLVGALARLEDLGFPRSLAADVLIAIVFQQFDNKPCPHCSGAGCAECHLSGIDIIRQPKFEVKILSDDDRVTISSAEDWGQLRQKFRQSPAGLTK